jgi:hypothetical protein
MPIDRTALTALDVFVGEWDVEAAFPHTAPAAVASRALVGRSVFEWMLDGAFLAQRSTISDPGVPDSFAIVGVDSEHGAYTQHYFDSRGVARVYAMTLGDGVWTLLREAPDFTPLDFSQRFTGRFSDDQRTIAGRWETRTGQAGWEHDFHLTYTRRSP